jgi:hypothetical protein
LLQNPRTPADQSIARHLLPRLLSFLTDTKPEDPENARTLTAHALTSFTAILTPQQLPVAMSLILPALLSRARQEGKEVYAETSARLLELAARDQTVFRVVVAGMNESQKAFVEEVVMSGRSGAKGVETDGEKEPTIALKMDFGGN